jgi:hypothetical protein
MMPPDEGRRLWRRSIHPDAEKKSSRYLGERHKDKEQDAYTFYPTEALIRRSLVKHSQAHYAPAKQ